MRDALRSWSGTDDAFAWQPFELATGDTLIVSVSVGEQVVDALVDSGSAVSVVGTSLAAKLNLDSGELRVIRGMTGRTSVKAVRNLDVGIHGDRRTLPIVMLVDLSTVSAAFGREIDLILGHDFLTGKSVALDFASSRIALAVTGNFKGGNGWRGIPLTVGANRELLVQASIAGLPDMPLILDLGSSNALMLSRDYVDQHKLLDNRRQSNAAIGGVDGIHVATVFTLDRAELGGISVHGFPTFAIERWLSTSAVGNLGLPFLSQFDIVLDLSAHTLWVRRPDQDRSELILKDRSGLGVSVNPSGLTVVHVAIGSPAAARGWKPGERIVKIDNNTIDAAYTRSDRWRWRFGRVGRLVRLTLADRQQREIRLADYY